jgi:DNA-binding response OmpR family regulator
VSGRRPRVLVVDDEAPLRELVLVTLREEFECVEVADGEAALEHLHSSPPDLVVLDAMLPGCSGLDVLREMREDDALRDVPVLMLSAWQSPQDVDAALQAGADRFIGKPFDVDELTSVARSLTGGRR